VTLTLSEAAAAALVAFLTGAIVVAYALDRCGLPIAPAAAFAGAVTAGATAFGALRRRVTRDAGASIAFGAVVAGVLAYLLWLGRPWLLPIGGGPDVAHHLALVDYIERHHRLVHDPNLGEVLGEMVDYTPGAHVLAVVAGAWIHSDGLHAIYPLVAFSVALKAGFVFLIAIRLLSPARGDGADGDNGQSPSASFPKRKSDERAIAPIAFAIVAVLLLFVPHEYFLRSFAQHSFIAQVIAELFAVAMWWAILVWDIEPSAAAAALAGGSGAAAFLVWPVWVGPLVLVFATVVATRPGVTRTHRFASLAIGSGPVALVAAMHAFGRVRAARIAATSGFVVWPSVEAFGWWFLVPAACGIVVAAFERRARSVVLLIAAIALQGVALAAIAYRSGADRPYLALKMAYLAIYPLAVAGAIAARSAWLLLRDGRRRQLVAWTPWLLVVVLAIVVGRSLAAAPRPKPVVSEPLVHAGHWARANVDPACVDYLVADGYSGYWLHLVVLGNARDAPRTRARDTFEPKSTLERWIASEGVPYAIAENFEKLPRDIRENVDVLARFGPAAVIKRRGSAHCPR
jgi:hypothetical protein